MTIAYNYNIVVRRIVVETEAMFEARVKEFPDLTEYADTPQEAYELAIDAINTVVDVFAEKGIRLPEAADTPVDFSGRVTLRLPKALHRALANAADDDDVSLNQHLVNVLSYFTGFAHAERAAASHWTPAKSAAASGRHPNSRVSPEHRSRSR